MDSKRTILRRQKPDDLKNMRALESDPLIMRFTPARVPQTPEQTEARLGRHISKQKDWEPYGIWMAEAKADKRFIGWFMLMPAEDQSLELGFMIVQSEWGKGFATEIGETLLELARKVPGIKGMVARTDMDNAASSKVLKKLGFEETGVQKIQDKTTGREINLRTFYLKFTI
jgi:RimJ/RimL family protein N-acetyltransferase